VWQVGGDDVGKFVDDGITPRHTRPRSGIQVSAANVFSFYEVRGGAKPEGYGSPIKLGMTAMGKLGMTAIVDSWGRQRRKVCG